ncbi:MAG: hypothetical protein IIZ78_27585 [Clostridiales bacterium]|nr:hypothetical protein [Clostridiales bacterium]
MIKGQNIRLLLSPTGVVDFNPLAAAKDLTVHFSAQTEDGSTKDVSGNWMDYDIASLSYDISSSCLVLTDDDALGELSDAKVLEDFINQFDDRLVNWRLQYMSGTNNRVEGPIIMSGQAKITKLDINAQNGQKASYSVSLNGYGPIHLGEEGYEYKGTFYSNPSLIPATEGDDVNVLVWPMGIYPIDITTEDENGDPINIGSFTTDEFGFVKKNSLEEGTVNVNIYGLPAEIQFFNVFIKHTVTT